MKFWPERYRIKKAFESVRITSWEDEAEEPDAWPPPTEYVKRVLPADDPLAVAIRARLGLEKAVKVAITESTQYGGSSEYTQENSYEMVIEAGDHKIEFDEDHGLDSNFLQLIRWLDQEPTQ